MREVVSLKVMGANGRYCRWSEECVSVSFPSLVEMHVQLDLSGESLVMVIM